MFIVSMSGGLASQMDQYSFMLTLKKLYPNVDIKMDVFHISKVMHNGYELNDVFGIPEDDADIDLIRKLSKIPLVGSSLKDILFCKFKNRICRYLGLETKGWIAKPDPSEFYKDYYELNEKEDYLFFGNFSNPKYKDGIEEEIRKAFTFKNPLDEKNLVVANKIKNENSVSVHVRHGDYISKKYNFPVVGLKYYHDAIEYIKLHVENPVFYFFSDDIKYVEREFHFIKNKVIVHWNRGKDSYKDMQLMTYCKHNIIANSGFSFWGAWLNSSENKIVINPDQHVKWVKYPITYYGWISMPSYMEYWN